VEYKLREDGIQSRRLSWLQVSEGSSKLLWPKGFRDTVTLLRPVAQLYGKVRMLWNQGIVRLLIEPSCWAQIVHMFTLLLLF